MAIILLNDIEHYTSGTATIHKVVGTPQKITLWFKFANEKIIRENYRLSNQEEYAKFKEAVNAILGEIPRQLDTDTLVGRTCYVEIEERPWKEGQNWTGVAKVLPVPSE